jgi:hypothetical protein
MVCNEYVASVPVLGLENAYVAGFGMAGTLT